MRGLRSSGYRCAPLEIVHVWANSCAAAAPARSAPSSNPVLTRPYFFNPFISSAGVPESRGATAGSGESAQGGAGLGFGPPGGGWPAQLRLRSRAAGKGWAGEVGWTRASLSSMFALLLAPIPRFASPSHPFLPTHPFSNSPSTRWCYSLARLAAARAPCISAWRLPSPPSRGRGVASAQY